MGVRVLFRTAGAVAALGIGLLGAVNVPHAATPAAASFPDAVLRTSTFHLDRAPGGDPWQLIRCLPVPATARHTNGLLAFDAPTPNCVGYYLLAPGGIWNRWANNDRGWIVEASLRVDARSTGSCPNTTGANLWMHDDFHLVQVGVSAQAVCLFYPEQVTVRRNTTVGFHTYRVEARGRTVRVYVDGQLVIDRSLSVRGEGTRALVFGDNNGSADPGTSGSQRSYWDYVAYDTTPNFDPAQWVGSDWPATVRRTAGASLPAG